MAICQSDIGDFSGAAPLCPEHPATVCPSIHPAPVCRDFAKLAFLYGLNKIYYLCATALVLELVDKRDLKSLGQKCPYGFDSRPEHTKPLLIA